MFIYIRGYGIILVFLDFKVVQFQLFFQFVDMDFQGMWKFGCDDWFLSFEEVMGLMFDELRVLVCIMFVGDVSFDMVFFNQWFYNMFFVVLKIKVEGMFLGFFMMFFIFMFNSVWNVVQYDKVCCFLGFIGLYNMIYFYE